MHHTVTILHTAMPSAPIFRWDMSSLVYLRCDAATQSSWHYWALQRRLGSQLLIPTPE